MADRPESFSDRIRETLRERRAAMVPPLSPAHREQREERDRRREEAERRAAEQRPSEEPTA